MTSIKLTDSSKEKAGPNPPLLVEGIKALRKFSGFKNTKEFSLNTDLGSSGWKKIEHNITQINYKHLEDIAKKSGIPIGVFLIIIDLMGLDNKRPYINGLEALARETLYPSATLDDFFKAWKNNAYDDTLPHQEQLKVQSHKLGNASSL